MKLKTLEELKQVAEIRPALRRARMSKRQRLERWAEALELAPQPCLRSLYETEYASPWQRHALREDDSPLSVAFQDAVLRAEGLSTDRYGDALKFFGLSDGELHHIVCYCHHGPTMAPKAVAHRVRAAASRTRDSAMSRGMNLLRMTF
jgi:predicted acyl esterase